MDEAEFTRRIYAAWRFFNETLGIGRAFTCRVSLAVDENFRDAAFRPENSYEDIFKCGLSRSHYNFILADYAYFQFSRTADDCWRLGYFPNPWLTGVSDAEEQLRKWEVLEEIGALTHEEVGDYLAELRYQAAVPPIRFEYAPLQYREIAHPAAHFHIGRHTENRWPSSIAIDPLAFSMCIAKLYYPQIWQKFSRYHGVEHDPCIDAGLIAAIANVRSVHQFSVVESQSIHFGKNLHRADLAR